MMFEILKRAYWTWRIVPALVLSAFFLGVIFTGCEFGTNEDAEQQPTETVTKVIIPGPTADPIVDPDGEQTSTARPPGPDSHEDARDETPGDLTQEEANQVLEPIPGLGPPPPEAPQLRGAALFNCPFQPVQNFSSRGGARVSQITVHFTVSDPGTLDAIQNLFNTPSFQASSHIGMEPSGRCEQWVKYSDKAWTQGAFNPVAESVEIICCRTSVTREWWLNRPIIKDGILASWIATRLKANGLPPRLVNPEGCTSVAGWTDHFRLECGNTHTDVEPNFPYGKVQKQVEALYKTGSLTKFVWRVSSGGEILTQKPTMRDAVAWQKDHPRRVRAEEEANGSVNLRKVRVSV